MIFLDKDEKIKAVRGWINFLLFFYILVTVAFGIQLGALTTVRPMETAKAIKDLDGQIIGGIVPYLISSLGEDQILIVGFSDSCPQIHFKAYYDLEGNLLNLESNPLYGRCY